MPETAPRKPKNANAHFVPSENELICQTLLAEKRRKRREFFFFFFFLLLTPAAKTIFNLSNDDEMYAEAERSGPINISNHTHI